LLHFIFKIFSGHGFAVAAFTATTTV